MRDRYDAGFFRYLDTCAPGSAEVVVPLVRDLLRPSSVLDIGCGTGNWVAAWLRAGISDVVGVDGDYVPREGLAIPGECFRAVNVAEPFRLGRQFDLVQCLEVAEHVSKGSAETLMDSLVAHGQVILFSAAEPGQGGENHVNEQPLEYWRDKFAARGFVAFDVVRPAIRGHAQVAPWYRYNTLVYAHAGRCSGLPSAIGRCALQTTERIPRVSPLTWRMHLKLLATLPWPVVSWLATARRRLLSLRDPQRSR